MKKRTKRTILSLTMLVLVCLGVYLNWKYTDSVKVLGEPKAVAGMNTPEATESVLPNETETEGDYFATARLTRQQARDNALSLLKQAAEEDGAAQDVKDKASESIQVMASHTMTEAQIENVVTAKGYQDCVAFMGDDSVTVAVSTETGELTEADVARITDITMTETNYPVDNIKIMAAK